MNKKLLFISSLALTAFAFTSCGASNSNSSIKYVDESGNERELLLKASSDSAYINELSNAIKYNVSQKNTEIKNVKQYTVIQGELSLDTTVFTGYGTQSVSISSIYDTNSSDYSLFLNGTFSNNYYYIKSDDKESKTEEEALEEESQLSYLIGLYKDNNEFFNNSYLNLYLDLSNVSNNYYLNILGRSSLNFDNDLKTNYLENEIYGLSSKEDLNPYLLDLFDNKYEGMNDSNKVYELLYSELLATKGVKVTGFTNNTIDITVPKTFGSNDKGIEYSITYTINTLDDYLLTNIKYNVSTGIKDYFNKFYEVSVLRTCKYSFNTAISYNVSNDISIDKSLYTNSIKSEIEKLTATFPYNNKENE